MRLLIFVGAFLSGCAFDPCNPGHGIQVDCSQSDAPKSDMGGGGTAFPLPFPEGESARCTQGAEGSYSHDIDSTRYAVDLDTPNDSDMELYAPVGGTAYVHAESATSGFGYHLNIDIGGGEYLVLAHFSEIFVEDGSEVAAGQLLGYEGCTGACSGDHVHVGLMEGDPAEMAQFGASVDALLRVADMDEEEPEFADVAASDFVCGTSGGHVYASDLPVAAWHPDGTLVMAPNDPKVYLLEDGKARHVADETVFWSHNFDFDDLTLVSDEEIACYGEVEDISAVGSVEAGYGEDGGAWLLVDDTDGSAWKQRLPGDGAEEVMESWGLSGDLGMDPTIPEETLDRYLTRLGTAPFRDGSIVKESGRSDVYVVSDGIALPVEDWNAYLLLGFGARDILEVDDGALEDVMGDNVGSCVAGIWCLDAEAVTSCGGGLELGSGESGGETYDTGASEEDGENGDGVEEDTDGDGVADASDNCPLHDNGDQGDIDGDGDGDSCDADMDGDGVANADDCDMRDPAEGECAEEPEDTSGEPEEAATEEPGDADAWSDYLWIDGDLLCFSVDGFAFPYDAADAYLVGYGGSALALDFTFQEEFRVSESGGAYCADTSALDFDDYDATLVSSLDASGGSAASYADTGDWWDNYDLCVSESETDRQFCASQGGWDYLVAFSVTSSGLFANGDGA